MIERAVAGRHRRSGGSRWRGRPAVVALAIAAAIAVVVPGTAQEAPPPDPVDSIKATLDACIAAGIEGADCAAAALADLDPIVRGTPADDPAAGDDTAPAGSLTDGTEHVSSASGSDGERTGRDTTGDSGTAAGADGTETTGDGSTTAPDGSTAEGDPEPSTDGSGTGGTEEAGATDTGPAPAPTDGSAPPPGTTTGTATGGADTMDASGSDGTRS